MKPWEEFQSKPAAPQTAPVDAATPAAAPTQAAPWQEYSNDPGITGSVTDDGSNDPFHGVPLTDKTGDLVPNLDKLTSLKVPADSIRDYVTQSGYVVTPELDKFISDNYDNALAGKTKIQWHEVPRENVGGADAAWTGLRSNALMGWDDELAALFGATGNKIGTALGLNDSTASFGEIYNTLADKERAHKDAAWDQHPILYSMGAVPGMAVSSPFGGRLMQGETLLSRLGGASTLGAGYGAISGAGNADGEKSRLAGAVEGGATGAVAGPLLYPVASGAQTVVSRIAERLPRRAGANAMNDGLEALLRRADQNPADVTRRATELADAGVDPRLVDIVDERGRGVIRNAASRMTGAREDMARAADAVYVDAQDRVAAQARNVISNHPQTARELATNIAEEQRALGPSFDAVRAQPVAITPEIVAALNTAEGRSVLRTIGRYMTPSEQQGLTQFISAMRAAGQIDPRMPPGVRQQIEQQLLSQSPFTVDMADKFARMITQRAGENPAMGRVASRYAEIIRGAARQQVPAYDQALLNFEANARVGNAASGERGFENTDFLRSPPDQYRPAVAAAEGTPPASVPVSEADALRIRARDDVVDKATAGSGTGALPVARQISRGSAQHDRNVALLGEDEAARLERGMAGEVTRVDNTRFVDPRIGSKTAPMQQDAADIAGQLVDMGANAASGGKWAVVRAVGSWLRSSGMREVDAERLTRDALNPARTQAAIDYLVQRGMVRARARSFVNGLIMTSAGHAAGDAAVPDRPVAPPNSVRAILKQN